MTTSFPKDLVRYVPLDVNENGLVGSATRLLKKYPTLEISGFVGDFDHSLGDLVAYPKSVVEETKTVAPKRLVAFLGGTIGNLTLKRRQYFLRRLSALLKEGDTSLSAWISKPAREVYTVATRKIPGDSISWS